MNRSARRLPRRSAMKSRGGVGLPPSTIGKSEMTATQCKPNEGREKVSDCVEKDDSSKESLQEKSKITKKSRETKIVKFETPDTTEKSPRRARSINKRATGRLLPTKSAFIPSEKKTTDEDASIARRNTRSHVKRELDETAEEDKSNKRSRTDEVEVEASRQKINSDGVWNGHYASLKEFKIENGHCLIPKVYSENQPLSSWVFRQRSEYKKRELYDCKSTYLTDERVAILEKIGFAWRTKSTKEQSALEKKKRSGPENERWETLFASLLSYKKANGNCLVPKIYKENQTLAFWVFKQRAQYKLKFEGGETRLTNERVDKLNSLGFVWDAKSDKEWRELDRLKKQKQADVLWDQHYKSLVAFKRGCGHTRVPKNHEPNQALSAWVFRQRSQHRALLKRKSNSLTERRQRKLMQIGFEFEVL